MTLRVPIVEIHHITVTEWMRVIKIRGLIARGASKGLLPPFLFRNPIGIAVGVCCLMPHQFHEPLLGPALDLEHHRLFQRPKPVVNKKEWNKNRRNANRYKPFITDVTSGMKL